MTVYSGLDSGSSIVYSTSRFLNPEESSAESFSVSTHPDLNYYFLDKEVETCLDRCVARSFDTCLRIIRYRDKKHRKLNKSKRR